MKKLLGMALIAWLALVAGFFYGFEASAQEDDVKTAPKVIYKKNTRLDFDGVSLQGELKNPAEFYFERRDEEKFDSLVKRRKNFHREMLRDAVLSK
jgi:hypothetical protein